MEKAIESDEEQPSEVRNPRATTSDSPLSLSRPSHDSNKQTALASSGKTTTGGAENTKIRNTASIDREESSPNYAKEKGPKDLASASIKYTEAPPNAQESIVPAKETKKKKSKPKANAVVTGASGAPVGDAPGHEKAKESSNPKAMSAEAVKGDNTNNKPQSEERAIKKATKKSKEGPVAPKKKEGTSKKTNATPPPDKDLNQVKKEPSKSTKESDAAESKSPSKKQPVKEAPKGASTTSKEEPKPLKAKVGTPKKTNATPPPDKDSNQVKKEPSKSAKESDAAESKSPSSKKAKAEKSEKAKAKSKAKMDSIMSELGIPGEESTKKEKKEKGGDSKGDDKGALAKRKEKVPHSPPFFPCLLFF